MDRRGIVGRLLLVVPLLAAGLALGAPRPAAAAFACTTDIIGGTIKESVVVSAGTSCTLNGAVVRGGVTIEPGARFQANNGTEIRGAVTATAPSSFFIANTVVRGGVTVTGGTDMASLTVRDSQVRGDLVLTGNVTTVGRGIEVLRNTVRGSVVLRNNMTGILISVEANAIEVNLDCSGNTPDPTDVGHPNTVGGVATGECVGLVAP